MKVRGGAAGATAGFASRRVDRGQGRLASDRLASAGSGLVYHSMLCGERPGRLPSAIRIRLYRGARIRLIRPGIQRHAPAFFGVETGAWASARADCREAAGNEEHVDDVSDHVRRPADSQQMFARQCGGRHRSCVGARRWRAATAGSSSRPSSRVRRRARPSRQQPAQPAQPAPQAAAGAGSRPQARSRPSSRS